MLLGGPGGGLVMGCGLERALRALGTHPLPLPELGSTGFMTPQKPWEVAPFTFLHCKFTL